MTEKKIEKYDKTLAELLRAEVEAPDGRKMAAMKKRLMDAMPEEKHFFSFLDLFQKRRLVFVFSLVLLVFGLALLNIHNGKSIIDDTDSLSESTRKIADLAEDQETATALLLLLASFDGKMETQESVFPWETEFSSKSMELYEDRWTGQWDTW